MAHAGASTVLVFGDQSVSTHSFLKELLSRSRTSTQCSAFLVEANAALRREIAELPALQRQSIPSFSTIQELNLRYQESKRSHTGVDAALLCISQLAHYIASSEEISWTGKEPAILAGLCTGALAASAVASCPSPGHIIPLASEVVRLAFRAGTHVEEASQLLSDGSSAESWSYLVPELGPNEAEAIIEKYNLVKNLPTVKTAYVSAAGSNTVTISGPPNTLKQAFADQSAFGSKKRIPLQIHAPFHASHIHTKAAIASVLSTDTPVIDASRPVQTVLSANTGAPIVANTTRELIESALFEMLCERLNLDRIIVGCSDLTSDAANDVHLSGIGPVSVVNSMITAIRQKILKNVALGSHAQWIANSSPARSPSRQPSSSGKLAIVGMAGRFPSSGDHNKFWDLLMDGIDAHRPIPPDRFDSKLYYDPTSKIRNTSHTPYGNFINDPGMFDPRFFNLSPREAAQTDPMQRLALVTAYEALEMAGYVPNRTPATQLERIGTYYGQTSDDWREINAAQDVDTYFITGGVRAFGPGRINYTFKFSGPSFNVDTACSSSMAAIQIACTALKAGECDTAVAGGVSILTNPDIFSGLSRGQFLSKTGNCQTFDNDADGYCRADGVGTVVIKRLEDAEADNDNILSIILGSATNHSAEAISITHPHAETQEFLYRKILDEAGVDALDVDYVEMHGTGTQAGDDTEMRSVTNVFAPSNRKRRADQQLYLGSVKANVGHGEAASGITALVKCLMMLERNKIPPHVGIKKTMNVNFPKDLAERNVRIALGGSRDFLPRQDRRRIVYVNNFSAAGGNTGLLMEEAPERQQLPADPRSTHVIAVSAKVKPSFKANVERMIAYIDEHPETRLEDLSYTLTARRMQHNYRFAVPVTSVSQARTQLKAALDNQVSLIPTNKPKVGFLYTGQGSVYTALGKEAFQNEPRFREDILAFDAIAKNFGFPSFLRVVDGSLTDINSGSATEVQLAITCAQIALTRLWKAWGVEPDFVMGHSLGEYAALYASGVLSIVDTIYLVGSRAQLLEKHCTPGSHAMLSVRAEKNTIEGLPADLGSKLAVSCLNAPQDTVLGGAVEDIELAAKHFTSNGLKSFKLELPFAFHTAQIDSILEPFQKVAASVTYSQPTIPFISTLTGERYVDPVSPTYLARHARESVRFFEALQSSRAAGIIDDSTIFLEVGPHPVCLSMVKSTLGTSYPGGASLRKNEDFYKTITSTICTLHTKGVPVAWNEFHLAFKKNLRLLTLPAYAFDEKNYWIQYTGDWCLNKNQPHPLIDGSEKVNGAVEATSPISTTTVHNVLEEKLDNNKLSMTTETDISRPDMMKLAVGHQVNGTVLVSSTVYGDMAVTIGEYIEKKHLKSKTQMKCNVSSMVVHKPFIANPQSKDPQILLCKIQCDLKAKTAELNFSSMKGKTETQHGHCIVAFEDPAAWRAEWQRNAYLIEGRIQELLKGVSDGSSQKINNRMAYKLFASLVDYGSEYCGMQEVVLNSENFEATASVKVLPHIEGCSFNLSPCWIDSTCHISGFIVNASDATNSNSSVYISHGWASMRVAEELSTEKSYRSYVRMQETGEGHMRAGDVYLFDTEKGSIVGVYGGVRFQMIPRSLLNTFLPPQGAAAAKAKTAPAAPKPQVVETKVGETTTVTTHNTAAAAPTAAAGSVVSRTMEIIAEEMGIGVDELDDPINFAEMGCDSLMSLSISGRMREEMDVDVHSHVFVDYPTVGQLKAHLKQFESAAEAEQPQTHARGALNVPSSGSSSASDTLGSGSASPSTPASTHQPDTESIPKLDLNKSLKGNLKKELPVVSVTEVLPSPGVEKLVNYRPERKATSVLLQGSPRRATKTMWIMPDGGGSATSYMSIPKLSDDLAVYGLNSPYMKTPEEYDQGLVVITTKFVTEMRRKQPEGPYTLAGWSAGGVVAFEACQQLVAAGQKVEKLLLLDAPCPLIIEPLPSTLHAFFNEIGLLGDGLRESTKVPSWLLPHFAASVAALSSYDAKPLPAGSAPRTLALWCTDGVCKEPEDPRPDPYPYGHAQWLLENRTDFGPNLWDRFIGEENMEMVTVSGNHFTMMRSPNVEIMGRLMSDFLLS